MSLVVGPALPSEKTSNTVTKCLVGESEQDIIKFEKWYVKRVMVWATEKLATGTLETKKDTIVGGNNEEDD